MTKSFATQAAAFALSALVTLGALAGVTGVAAHEHAAAVTVAMEQSMTQTASIQNVVVIGRRTQRA